MSDFDQMPTDIGDGLGGGYPADEEGTDVTGGGYTDGGGEGEGTVLGSRFEEGDETILENGYPSGERQARKLVEAILWVRSGNRRGNYHPIRHGTMIGREEGTIRLNDPKVSKQHARITFESKHFVLWDIGSSNGTYVNGKRIRAATPLEENDVVKIGETQFVVKLLNAVKKVKPKAKPKAKPKVKPKAKPKAKAAAKPKTAAKKAA